jgi:hypothetical protein
MPKVVGIGGVFFRAADPGGLAEWYVSLPNDQLLAFCPPRRAGSGADRQRESFVPRAT